MKPFTYTSPPYHVVFGPGRLEQIADEVDALGCRHAIILTTPGRRAVAERAAELLGKRSAVVHDGAMQHVPERTVKEAIKAADACDADLLISVGGGSTVGLAKGVALETSLPILAVPTTYSGSELTRIWGISREGSKVTGRDPRVLPASVIYDPELLVSLPPDLSLVSGVNAMAHAVEALYAPDANPVSTVLAEESIQRLGRSLPTVVRAPGDFDARADSLAGAMCSAMVLDQVGMGIHHKLCHVLGGRFGLAHAPTHTVLLPYALAANSGYATDAVRAIERALGCEPGDAPGAIQDISRTADGPVSLEQPGLARGDLAEVAAEACRDPYPNPRPLDEVWVRDLLEEAFEGTRP